MALQRYVVAIGLLLSLAAAVGPATPSFAGKPLLIYPPVHKPVAINRPGTIKPPTVVKPIVLNKPVTVGNPVITHKPVVSFISVNECTQMGGRVVHNPSCYSGQQCRGGILNNCIDKKQ